MMEKEKKKILALSWRDVKSPKAGGAEVQTHEMLKRISDRVEIEHISPCYKNMKREEVIDGIRYIRHGNVFTVIFFAIQYYKKNKNGIDYVIDQCNTHRFFSKFWVESEKRIFLIYQLTREIWKVNLPFPLAQLGMILETPLLKLNKNDIVITESKSTKDDLVSVGFCEEKIHIIPIGLNDLILNEDRESVEKEEHSLIYVGRYSEYKGIDKAIEAMALIKKEFTDSKIYICGKEDVNFTKQVIKPICEKNGLKLGSMERDGDVILCGYVSEKEKYELMKKSKLLLFPSIREGWGIIVTEAAYLGTVSIVNNAPGAIDAVEYGKSGYISTREPSDIAQQIRTAFTNDADYYEKRNHAIKYASKFIWEKNENLLYDLLYPEEN